LVTELAYQRFLPAERGWIPHTQVSLNLTVSQPFYDGWMRRARVRGAPVCLPLQSREKS